MIEPHNNAFRISNDNESRRVSETQNKNYFYFFCALSKPFASAIPGLVVLLFLGALSWAREQDPFARKWFATKTGDGGSVECVAVLPRPSRPCPVVIYAHGSGGTLMTDGDDLRHMAELGLAVVSLEYDQTNPSRFGAQFEALLHYVGQQVWANTNAIVWVGYSLGSTRMFDFALQHPDQQPERARLDTATEGTNPSLRNLSPQARREGLEKRPVIVPRYVQPKLLVLLGGAGLREGESNRLLSSLHCPVFLVHGEQDQSFPVADTKRLASFLETDGLPVDLKIIPNLTHLVESDRGVTFRAIGEYCLTHLAGGDAWQKYHSIAQWQEEAPELWLFWLPAAAWAVGWVARSQWRKPRSTKKVKLNRWEIGLRWLAVVLATWALAETSLHLVPPHFSVSDKSLSIARQYLVRPKQRSDFEFLAAKPVWADHTLKALLDHVELAGYNRELINWHLDEKIFQDFVLSPVISGNPHEELNWRRPLWEEFYPRIRHENSPEDAARIVARHLRERVTIAPLANPPRAVPDIWLRQISDQAGFETIYVADLRSVGVPARLASAKTAEYWDGKNWQSAPRPILETWQDVGK